MKFSERNAIIDSIKSLQIDSIDRELKIGIWNTFKEFYLNNLPSSCSYNPNNLEYFFINLWKNFFKIIIDEIPVCDEEKIEILKDKFFKFKWYEIYDFLEFIVSLNFSTIFITKFINEINKILEIEFSAYRFINNKISNISNEFELDQIKNTVKYAEQFTGLEGVNIHLTEALNKLSDRNSPDYRNSIKESISAVEAACRFLTCESTLGSAIKKLNLKNENIDKNILKSIENLYTYSNNKNNGIRHAIVHHYKTCDFHDAKYILVISSTVINYLISKNIDL